MTQQPEAQPEVKPRLLLVDDEPSVLDALRRTHRKRYDLTTAVGGAEALTTLEAEESFDLIVSDQQMPEMSGTQFLAKAAELYPDCVRLMLTGNADLQTAIDAVNTGGVFRFMTKPCAPETFTACVDSAMEQVRLRRAEQEVLEGTLQGSIQVLAEVLSLTNPEAFGRAERLRKLVEGVLPLVPGVVAWQVRCAALLSQLGCVALPAELLTSVMSEGGGSPEHQKAYRDQARIGARLVGRIPRMQEISSILSSQYLSFRVLDAMDDLSENLRRSAQVLSVCRSFDELSSRGVRLVDTMRLLAEQHGAGALPILKALVKIGSAAEEGSVHQLPISGLKIGMSLVGDVYGGNGSLIVKGGQTISESLLERLWSCHQLASVVEPIAVRMGETVDAAEAA